MKKISAFFKSVYTFVRYDVWRITESELTRGKWFGYRTVRTLYLAIRGFFDDELYIKASALTYSLMFATVPILALMLAIAKGFGFEQIIEDWLYSSMIGSSGMVPIIMGFIQRYLETAQGGIFVGVGILFLLWSVYSFFQQVEDSFNKIWQVKKSRSYIRQFTAYFAILLLIPILIVISSGLSIYINSVLSQSAVYTIMAPAIKAGLKLLPFLICWIVFTLMYAVIPNTRVKFWSAALSGVIAGTAYQLFQMLYIWGQVYLSRYNVVYGTFAAIPLLLLWMQISCLIILLGAEISYAAQSVENFDYEVDTKNISRRYKDFITLYICYMVIKRFEEGKKPMTAQVIALKNHLPIRLVTQLLGRLVDVNILAETYIQGAQSKTYQPALDINKITVNLVFDRINAQGSELFLKGQTPEMIAFWDKMVEINAEQRSQTDKLLVKDIIMKPVELPEKACPT